MNNLDKVLEDILNYAEPKTPTKYWRKIRAIAQIKATILKELEKEMPTPEEEGFEGKDPSVFPNERNYEATTRNELLADCLEVVRKTLQ